MYKHRRWIIGGVALLLVAAMVFGVVINAFSATSKEIKGELDELQSQADEIEARQKELQAQIDANNNKEANLVEQKMQIDEMMDLLQQEIANKNLQIKEYNLLIAEKQNELDDAIAEKEALDAKYKARIRAMEEGGKVSYWSILFNANSFADLLDRVDMINEIADADTRMLEQLQQAALEIEASREALAAEKVALEEMKTALAAKEVELSAQREESDRVLAELILNGEQLSAAAAKYDAMEEELAKQIAEKEREYNEAKDKEEEARRLAELQQQQQAQAGGGGNSGGFIRPVSGGYISCGYGYRIHPITGNYSFHTGIDYAVPYGTPIYASKSGTVTTAAYQNAWGKYVTINHPDGYTTLYAHMSSIAVSYGQTVSQGQVIGYVGSTGWSTGAHLHFTIYYNGQLVNPANYVH